MANQTDKTQQLYNNLKQDGYDDIGTLDEFRKTVSDRTMSDKLYKNLLDDGYSDLGTSEEFYNTLNPAPPKSEKPQLIQSAVAPKQQEPAASVAPGEYPQPTDALGNVITNNGKPYDQEVLRRYNNQDPDNFKDLATISGEFEREHSVSRMNTTSGNAYVPSMTIAEENEQFDQRMKELNRQANWRDEDVETGMDADGRILTTKKGELYDQLYQVFDNAVKNSKPGDPSAYSQARTMAEQMGIGDMGTLTKLIGTVNRKYAKQSAAEAVDAIMQNMPDRSANPIEDLQKLYYDRALQDQLNRTASNMGNDYQDYVNMFLKPQLVEAMKQKYGGTDNDWQDVNGLFSNWQHVSDRIESDDAEKLMSEHFTPAIDQAIDDAFQRAAEKSHELMKENEGGNVPGTTSGAGIIGASLYASHESNKLRDPELIQKEFEDMLFGKGGEGAGDGMSTDKLMDVAQQEIMKDENLKSEIAARAKEKDMLPADYTKKYVVPQLINSIRNRFEQQFIQREMPKSTFEYIMRGLTDDNILAMIANRYMLTEGQQRIRNMADSASREGRSVWAEGARLATGMAADFWLWGGWGKLGAKATGELLAQRIAERASAEHITKAAAARLIEEEGKQYLGKGVVEGMMRHIPSSAITMGGAEATTEAVRSIRDREELKDIIGNTIGAAASGSITGTAFGITGGTMGRLTSQLSGAARLAGKLATFGAEAGTMYATEELQKMGQGEEAFDNPFEGLIHSAIKLGFIKASANPIVSIGKLMDAVAHPVKAVKGAMTGDRPLLDEDDVKAIQESASGKELMEALTNMRPARSTDKEEREGYITPEQAERGAEAYRDFMQDPEQPYERKKKVAYLLGGEIKPAGLEIKATTFDVDGKVYVRTYDLDGNLIREIKYDSFEAAEKDAENRQKMIEANINTALADKINEIDAYDRFNQYIEDEYQKVAAKMKPNDVNGVGEALSESDRQILYLHQHNEEILDVYKKLESGEPLGVDEQQIADMYKQTFDGYLKMRYASQEFVREFEYQTGLPEGAVKSAYLGDGKGNRTQEQQNILDAYRKAALLYIAKRQGRDINAQEFVDETEALPDNTQQQIPETESPVSETGSADIATRRQEAYDRGAAVVDDESTLLSIGHDTRLAEARMQQIPEQIRNDIMSAAEAGDDQALDDIIAKAMPNLTPEQQQAVDQYRDMIETQRGIEDAITDQVDAYERERRADMEARSDEQGMITPLVLNDGSTVYYKSGDLNNHYGGIIATKRNGENIQVPVRSIVTIENPVGVEELLATDVEIYAEWLREKYDAIANGTRLPVGTETDVIIGGQPYHVIYNGTDVAGNPVIQMEDGSQMPMSPQDFQQAVAQAENMKIQDQLAQEAESARLAKQQERYSQGIAGYKEGNPDLTAEATDAKVAAEYMMEQAAGDDRIRKQQVSDIDNTKLQLKQRQEDAKQEMKRLSQWITANEDIADPAEMDEAMRKYHELEKAVADIDIRQQKYGEIRQQLMTSQEKAAFEQKRRTEVSKARSGYTPTTPDLHLERNIDGIITSGGLPRYGLTPAEDVKKYLLNKFNTLDEAQEHLLEERKKLSNYQREILQPKIGELNDQLSAHISGLTELSSDEIQGIMHNIMDLEAEQDALSNEAINMKKISDSLPKLFEKKVKAEELTDSIRMGMLEKATSPEQKLNIAREIYKADRYALDIIYNQDPQTVEEFVAANLGMRSLNWEGFDRGERHIIGVKDAVFGGKSAASRGFGKDATTYAFNSYLAAKGEGKGFNEVVHEIYEAQPDLGDSKLYTTEDISDALINLLLTAKVPSDISHLIINNRIAQAEEYMREQEALAEEAEMEAWAEAYHMDPEEREAYDDYLEAATSITDQNTLDELNKIFAEYEQDRRSEEVDLQHTNGAAGPEGAGGKGQVQGQGSAEEIAANREQQEVQRNEAGTAGTTVSGTDVPGGAQVRKVTNDVNGIAYDAEKDVTLQQAIQETINEIDARPNISINTEADLQALQSAGVGEEILDVIRGDLADDSTIGRYVPELGSVLLYGEKMERYGLTQVMKKANIYHENVHALGSRGFTKEDFAETARLIDQDYEGVLDDVKTDYAEQDEEIQNEEVVARFVQSIVNGGPLADFLNGEFKDGSSELCERINNIAKLLRGNKYGEQNADNKLGGNAETQAQEGSEPAGETGEGGRKRTPSIADKRANLKVFLGLLGTREGNAELEKNYDKIVDNLDDAQVDHLVDLAVKYEKADNILEEKAIAPEIIDYINNSQDQSFSARLARAVAETNTNPTEAQKRAGNYRKPELKFGGYTFRIENPKGSTRSGVDRDGKPWSIEMHDTYGYIEEKTGKDGDKMDFFINDDEDLDNYQGRIWVIDQKNEDGSFDEHKVMYGYRTLREARKAYERNYEDGWWSKHVMAIMGVMKDDFDAWLAESDHKLKPFSEYYSTKMNDDVVASNTDQLLADIKERQEAAQQLEEAKNSLEAPTTAENASKKLQQAYKTNNYTALQSTVNDIRDMVRNDQEILYNTSMDPDYLEDYNGKDPEMLAEQFLVRISRHYFVDPDEDTLYIVTGIKSKNGFTPIPESIRYYVEDVLVSDIQQKESEFYNAALADGLVFLTDDQLQQALVALKGYADSTAHKLVEAEIARRNVDQEAVKQDAIQQVIDEVASRTKQKPVKPSWTDEELSAMDADRLMQLRHKNKKDLATSRYLLGMTGVEKGSRQEKTLLKNIRQAEANIAAIDKALGNITSKDAPEFQIESSQVINSTKVEKNMNPRDGVPAVRGGWNKNKIKRYLKDHPTRSGVHTAARAISEFDNIEELKDHMFYHGTAWGSDKLKPSITMSDRDVERYGGGGYGDKYWGISVSKDKKIASRFSGTSSSVRIYPIILLKDAKVVERSDFSDAYDAEEHIEELWNDGVDAVWIGKGKQGGGEQELLILNPRAVVNIGTPDFYKQYLLGHPENPLNIADDKAISKMYETAKKFVDFPKPKKPVKPLKYIWEGPEKGFKKDKNGLMVKKSDDDYAAEMADYENRLEEYNNSEALRNYQEMERQARNDIRFQIEQEPAPTFYSNAMKAVEGIKQEKATPDQWLAMIEKAGGLKAGEDKWLGLSDWLQDQKDKKSITKQEVMDYIRQNQIQVEEVHYDENSNALLEYIDKNYPGFDKAFFVEADDFDQTPNYSIVNLEAAVNFYNEYHSENEKMVIDKEGNITDDQYDDLINFAAEIFENKAGQAGIRNINPTRLNYTTNGLENRHEIALTVPTVLPYQPADTVHFGDAGEGRAVVWVRFGETSTNMNGSLASRIILDDIEKRIGTTTDYSKMSDEDAARRAFANYLWRDNPDVKWMRTSEIPGDVGEDRAANVVALFDKLVADNKNGDRVLVIDEIQSNRHQKGRELGYLKQLKPGDPLYDEYQKLRNNVIEKAKLYDDFLNEVRKKYGEVNASVVKEEEAQQSHNLFRELEDARIDLSIFERKNHLGNFASEGVPEAPFEKNWHELAMKRILRYAAENGYDKIAWTTGGQQAERYNIGGIVPYIDVEVNPGDNDFYRDMRFSANGNSCRVAVNNNGTITLAEGLGDGAVGKSLGELLGKEVAVKIMAADKNTRIDLQNTRIGGEGMKGFYDEMLPRFMNKYGKKWGVKVQDVELPNIGDHGVTMHSIDVTPEMKESVMQGQPMFAINTAWEEHKAEVAKTRQRATDALLMALDNAGVKYKKVTDEEAARMLAIYTDLNQDAIIDYARKMRTNDMQRYAVVDTTDPYRVPKYFEKRQTAQEYKSWAGRKFKILDLGYPEETQQRPAELGQAAEIMPEIDVWHGSGTIFDKFDHSHMGEGARSQTFGWGTYVTTGRSIAEGYTTLPGDIHYWYKGEMISKSKDMPLLMAAEIFTDSTVKTQKQAIKFAERMKGRTDANNTERLKLWDQVIDVIKKSDINDFKTTDRTPVLYKVQIPDDTGNNYLDWMLNIKKPLRRKIAEAVRNLEGEPQQSFIYANYKNGWQSLADMIERNQWAYKEIHDRLLMAFGGRIKDAEKVSKLMSSIGFVGVKYPAGTIWGNGQGQTNYVIFNEDDAKITDRIEFMFDEPEKPIFISNARMAVDGIKQEKATPDQWLKMIEKAGGIKSGEDKWTGLSDWLKDQQAAGKKSITKQEIQEYLNENQIQIEEVHYGQMDVDNNPEMIEFRKEFNGLVQEFKQKQDAIEEEYNAFSDEMFEKYGNGWAGDGIDRLSEEDRKRNDDMTERYDALNSNAEILAFDEMVNRHGDDFEMGFEVDDNGVLQPQPDYDSDADINGAAQSFLGGDNPINPTRLRYTTDFLKNNKEIALTVPTIEGYRGDLPEVHFADDLTEGKTVAWIRFGDTTIPVYKEEVWHFDKFQEPYKNANGGMVYYPEGKTRFGNNFIVKKTDKDGVDRYAMFLGAQLGGVFNSLDEAKAALNDYFAAHPKRERTGSKKVLVIDEIQSQRHQDARTIGYRASKEEIKKLRNEIDELTNKRFEVENKKREIFHELANSEDIQKLLGADGYLGDEARAKYQEIVDNNKELTDLSNEYQRITDEINDKMAILNNARVGVPEAPFEKNWHELAMKRMLRYAAENGYDKIAWTTGSQQAERYNMGEIVDSIEVNEWGLDVNGYEQDKDLQYAGPSSWTPGNDVEKSIKEYIEYCMSQGDDFSTSRGYAHNQITDAPEEAVGWTHELVNKVANAIRDDVTGNKDLRDVVIHLSDDDSDPIVLTVNREGKVLESSDSQFEQKSLGDIVGKELAVKIIGTDKYEKISGVDLSIGGEGMKGFYDEILVRFMNKYGKKWGVKVEKVNLPEIGDRGLTMWSIDVTPEMKESVMQGQPMFQRGAKGAVYGWTDGQQIYLTERGMNPNTPMHEYTHIWGKYMEKNDPELWKEVVDAMKQTDMWQQIRENPYYRSIWNDDNKMASEVLSRLSGATTEEEFVNAATGNKKDSEGILKAVKNTLQKFWEKIKEFFTGKKEWWQEDAEQGHESWMAIVRRPLKDLLEGFNPVEAGTATMPQAGDAFEKTLMGVHNISEEKLKKAIKLGGLANPSMAVIDTKHGIHTDFGKISLIPRSSLINARTGRNAGTYAGDAWTPTYPDVRKFITKKGEKHLAEMAKTAAAGNKDLEHHLYSRLYDYVNGDTNRIHLLYLLQKGIEPTLKPERTWHTHEEYEELQNIFGKDLEYSTQGLTDEQNEKLLDLMMKDYIADINKQVLMIKDEAKREPLAQKMIEQKRNSLVDENGKIWLAKYDTYIYDVKRDEMKRQNPKIDWYATDSEADYQVAKMKLAEDYDQWKENLFNDEDLDEKIFVGWDNDGNKRYIPNTLKNVSRVMNREPKTNAYSEGGLNATRSVLLKNFKTLEEIRRHKDMLVAREDYKENQEEMSDELFSIIERISASQKVDSNPFINNDIAEARLQEAIVKKDPIAFLNKEYGYSIEKDSELASDLMNFIEKASTLPVVHFETKFERPVTLDEFAIAVVPDNTDADVIKALKEAGLEIRTYNGDDQSDARTMAVMDAVGSRNDILFHIEEDPETIVKLENEPKIKVYRSMQIGPDGKLYPPMSAKVDGEWRMPTELGTWERSEERPELADNAGKFRLDKGNKKGLKAAYNPYFHTSTFPLNDQFSEAQDRPELVTVEVEIPNSELTSGYRAEKAKDEVGEKDWKAGAVQGQMTGQRKVILSRWDKPIRIVPDEEIAEIVAPKLKEAGIIMPTNVVTPSLRKALEAKGIEFIKTDNSGKLTDGEYAGMTWAQWWKRNASTSDVARRDKEYAEAVAAGDMEKVDKMLREEAKKKGYSDDSSYQGSLAFNGAAPSKNAYFETRSERKEAFDNEEFEGDFSLGDYVESGIDVNDLDWQLKNPDRAGRTQNKRISINNINNAIASGTGKIKMYRAVDAAVKENSFRNGDWITPSRQYAEDHIKLQDWKKGRIIEQEVSFDDIWWDGNDINEWGYDDGKDYAYNNTKNNRKLLEPTYDEEGNLIPLSQRFNEKNHDIRYRRVTPVIERINDKFNADLEKLSDKSVFDLGNPSTEMIAAGMENKPMRLYGTKLIAKLNKHGYKPEDVKNLPIATHNPIAIFSGSHPNSFAILTELHINGENVLVTLASGKGNDIDFNIISSVYDKNSDNVINWINKNKGLYYDKEKALDYLHLSTPIVATSDPKATEPFDSAANIVRDFQNPKLSEENLRKIYANEVEAAEDVADQLGGVKIVFESEAGEGVQGWYDPNDNSVHIVLPEHKNVDDVKHTVFHEKLGHEGLVALFGDQAEVNKFGEFIFTTAKGDLHKRILDKAGEIDPYWEDNQRYIKAAQEVFADIAADGPANQEEFSLWTKVKHYLIKWLNKLGLRIKGILNDHDLRYYVLKTGEALKRWNKMTPEQQAEAAKYDPLYSRRGKPRKRNNESMAQYLERLRNWEKWKSAEERAAAANDPMPEADKINEKYEEKYHADLAEWKQRNGITDDASSLGEFPKRRQGESPQEFAARVADYETQKDTWQGAPSFFDYMQQANEEYKQAYQDWKVRYDLAEAENVDLHLYEGDPIEIVTMEDLEAEAMADAELASGVGVDVTSEGAKRQAKLAIINRRKNLESANAEDAIWLYDLAKRIDVEAKRQGVSVEELRKALPDIIEGTYFEEVIKDENGNVVTINDISDQLPIKEDAELTALLDHIKDWYDEFYHVLEDAGLRGEAGYIEEGYVNHVWSREKSDPKAWEKYVENFQRTKSPNMRHREIETYRMGRDVGLAPKFDDIIGILSYYSVSNNEAVANKKFLDDLSFIVVEETNADGEVVSILPLLNSNKPEIMVADRYEMYHVPGVGDVWVIKDIQRQFANVFGTMRTKDVQEWVSKMGKIYDTASSTAKKIELSFSAFHMGALTEVAMAQMRPDRAMKALCEYIIFDCAKKGTIPAYAHPEDFKFAASHLVQLGATQDYAAADVNNLTEKLREVVRNLANEENLAKKGAGMAATPLAAALDYINKGMDKVLWNYLHDGLKIACFKMFAEQVDQRVAKEGLDAETREQLLDEAGQYVNDTFGGQYFELLDISPALVKWLRRAFLSPDWLISTQRHFLANFGFGSLYSESGFLNYLRYNADNIKRAFGADIPRNELRRFRSKNAKQCYILGVCGFFYVLMNALNAMFRAWDEDKEKEKADEIRQTNPEYRSPYELAYPDGMKWYDYTMYGNTLGQQTHLFLGRYNDGTEYYVRWGKQFREFPELFMGRHGVEFPTPLMERMSGKANPIGRYLMYDLPLTVGMYGYNQPRETKEIADKYGNTVALLAMTARKFMPFSVPTQEDKEFKILDLVMPSQKGFTRYKAVDYFKTFIQAGDMDGVMRTYEAAAMNGVDAEECLKAAITTIKATQRKELQDGITDLTTAFERYDAATNLKDKKVLRQKLLKYLAESEYKVFTRDEAREQVETFLNGEPLADTDINKYIELSTAADIRDDYRMSKIKKQAKKYVGEVMAADGDRQKKLRETYAAWFKIDAIIKNSNKEINKLKKYLGKGKDQEAMDKIREIRTKAQQQIDEIDAPK